VVPPHKLVRGVPRQLEEICQRAMARDREHRFMSAQAMAHELQRFLDGHRERAKLPLPNMLAVIGVFALCALGLLAYLVYEALNL
jgi:hypothetical protein